MTTTEAQRVKMVEDCLAMLDDHLQQLHAEHDKWVMAEQEASDRRRVVRLSIDHVRAARTNLEKLLPEEIDSVAAP